MKVRIFGPGGRIRLFFRDLKQLLRQYRWEKRFSIGGNKFNDKHFYVIGINQYEEGLFSIVYQILLHIEYALKHNMIPVVNIRDFNSMFQKDGINAWEEFFEQPCNYTLEDIIGAKKATFSYDSHYPHLKVCWNVADLSNKELETLKDLYKKYIRPSKAMKKYIQTNVPAEFTEAIMKVGCICRGTDYFHAPKLGIAKQPTAEMMIEKVKECMYRNKVEKVYCATEDEQIYKSFQKAFGKQLIPNHQQMYKNNNGKFLSDINREQNIDVYKINREYFLSLWMISQCNYFIGGNVSGSNAVILMENHFKEFYVFKLGAITKQDVTEFVNNQKS